MKTTKIETIEKQINLATDSFLQNIEFEIRKTESIKKLNLWIISLSTGIELFFLNKVTYSAIEGFNLFLFYVSGAAFLYNAIIGLYIQKTVTAINNFETEHQQRLHYQRIILLGVIDGQGERIENLVADYDSRELILKLNDLNYYYAEKNITKTTISLGKKINQFAESSITYVLMVQSIAIALFFLFR